jgi:prolipoprotein diacylglyceryltransferase
MLYLMFAGFERLVVEFFRLNPRLWLDLSQAQWISIGLIIVGAVGWFRLDPTVPSPTPSRRSH